MKKWIPVLIMLLMFIGKKSAAQQFVSFFYDKGTAYTVLNAFNVYWKKIAQFVA
jgi:hypothetical protein